MGVSPRVRATPSAAPEGLNQAILLIFSGIFQSSQECGISFPSGVRDGAGVPRR